MLWVATGCRAHGRVNQSLIAPLVASLLPCASRSDCWLASLGAGYSVVSRAAALSVITDERDPVSREPGGVA